jgi:parallel beta-helix repeat protein
VFENTGFGISLSEEASPLIVNNRITKNVDGIVAAYSTAPVLRNNVIESNQRDGIVVVSNAKPDLGTAENPGQNRIRNNGRYDLNNATRTNTLVAYGNDINQKQILGKVDFVGAVIAGNPGSGDNSGSTALKDVQGHWAQAYIQNLASQGVIAGFNDGTFRPNQPVTRAQFAAIINKAFAPIPARNATKFADVSSKSWAAAPIQTAYQGGFLQGYPGNKFLPEQPIPKVQVLVSLASGLKLRSEDTSVLSVYSDAKSIPNYALTAVAGATKQEMVVNYPIVNQLNPNQQATRAEVAAYVYQALVKSGQASAIPSDYLVKNPLTAQR